MIFFQVIILICFIFSIRHTIFPDAIKLGRSPYWWSSLALGGWAAFLVSDFLIFPLFIPHPTIVLTSISILAPWIWLILIKIILHLSGVSKDKKSVNSHSENYGKAGN